MTEKNMILNDWRNRHSVMTPLRKESENPVARFLTHQLALISKFFGRWITP